MQITKENDNVVLSDLSKTDKSALSVLFSELADALDEKASNTADDDEEIVAYQGSMYLRKLAKSNRKKITIPGADFLFWLKEGNANLEKQRRQVASDIIKEETGIRPDDDELDVSICEDDYLRDNLGLAQKLMAVIS